MRDSQRIQVPDTAEPGARGRVRCSRCRRATTGGKPYCHEHVDEMPYVQQLAERITSNARRSGRRPA